MGGNSTTQGRLTVRASLKQGAYRCEGIHRVRGSQRETTDQEGDHRAAGFTARAARGDEEEPMTPDPDNVSRGQGGQFAPDGGAAGARSHSRALPRPIWCGHWPPLPTPWPQGVLSAEEAQAAAAADYPSRTPMFSISKSSAAWCRTRTSGRLQPVPQLCLFTRQDSADHGAGGSNRRAGQCDAWLCVAGQWLHRGGLAKHGVSPP